MVVPLTSHGVHVLTINLLVILVLESCALPSLLVLDGLQLLLLELSLRVVAALQLKFVEELKVSVWIGLHFLDLGLVGLRLLIVVWSNDLLAGCLFLLASLVDSHL